MLIDVTNIVLDLYTTVIGQSIIVDQLLAKLRQKLLQEVALQKQILELMGGLDMLFAMTSHRESGIAGSLSASVNHHFRLSFF